MRRSYEERRLRHAAQAKVLADAHAAAEAASRAKSQFLSHMSHELRTPLNAVIGYAHWLGHRDLGPKEREAASTILSSGEHLLAVISDILDIAKVEAGKLDLLPAAFDLRDCIASIDRMMRLKAEEKALDFEAKVAPDVPASVVADQKRIRQVLINLLGNAVKFTPSGRVALYVSVVSGNHGAWRLRFVVEDSGIGIPQDRIHSIFQPFEQVGNAVDRSGGTGLGLSITKQIIDLMGGGIQVETAPGEGSRFIVEVMVGVVESPACEAPATISRLAAPDTSMAAPDGPTLQHLLTLARTGNMGGLRREAARIKAEDPSHASFADKLDTLCAAYQSPAVLRLIESLAAQEVAQ
jgi:signal transduction histidine kinase